MLRTLLKAVALTAMMAAPAMAETWTLDPDGSKLAFGSVKKDTIGEVHSFEGLSGSVAADGSVAVEIDLTSVETYIDIRNERMMEHVFKAAKSASLAASFDMDEVKSLAVGATTLVDVEGTLNLLGTAVDIEAEMFVVRISETQVMATTNEMLWVSTADAGIDAGIDKLMELAKLPGITRTFPVTMRLMFNMDEQKAEAAPAAPATAVLASIEGDVKAGKKVFRKCKACHALKEGKNGAGPSLYNIVGAQAGQVEGFSYSNKMKESGLTWDVATLSAFLTKPKDVVKGTSMAFPGLRKEKDVVNLIAYLANP